MHDIVQILTLVGIAVFLICIVTSRILSERAFSRLEPEQKLALLDAFSGTRMYFMIPFAALVVLFLVLESIAPDHRDLTVYGFTALFLLVAFGGYGFVLYKTKLLALPRTYMRQITLSRGIALLGLLVFASALMALRIT